MKAISLPLFAALVLVTAPVLHAQVLSDSFTTFDTTKWTAESSSSPSATYLTTSGGLLTEKVGSLNSGHRSFIVSQSTAINPFSQALTFTFSGLTLSGTPTGATGTTGWVAFYATVGQVTNDTLANYYPSQTLGGDTLSFELADFTNGYQIKMLDSTGTTISSLSLTLAGTPTDISWTIDGTGSTKTYSFTLTGATFTTNGLNTYTGTFTNFNLAGLGTTPASRLAFGVLDSAAPSTYTTATLDSISVDATVVSVPEPGTWSLLAGGLLALGIALRRRGRSLAAVRL